MLEPESKIIGSKSKCKPSPLHLLAFTMLQSFSGPAAMSGLLPPQFRQL